MEVKIDADELFELRRRVSDLEAQKREVDEEERRWFDFRLHSAVQFLKENNPDVSRLKEERDWWRDAALSYETTILDSVRILDEGPLCSSTAEELGYEVPE